ncbi:reverse transcriptase domain-containing protein, partial [Tanacetum coccineum]
MDIQDDVKASKGDELPKSSLLSDSDQNNPLNKPQLSSGVKGIDRVSIIKLKDANVNFSGIAPVVSDKLTDLENDKVNVGKDKAPKHKLTDLEKDKVNVGKDKAPKHKAPVKNSAAVLYKARKQKTPVKKPAAVVEKPDAVVDKAPKHKAPAKKPTSVVVQDKDNVTASAKELAFVVVQDKDNVVVNDPAELDQEKDKEKHKAPAKEPASVVGSVCDVVKQILFDVEDALKNEAIEKASDVVNDSVVVESVCDVVKASDALKNKAADVKEKSDGKGKKSTVDKDNDKILVVPDWNLPFELMCDASDFAIGAVLGQRKTKHFQPIHYASKTITEAQIHYTTTEKEMLAVVYAFEKFRPYLVLSKSIVYTDHSALKYLMNKQDAKPRLLRWVFFYKSSISLERITKKRTKNEAKTTKPDTEWKSRKKT